MDFPIDELMDLAQCRTWVERHLHPEGMKCPACGQSVEQARRFRQTRKSQLTVYRCQCGRTYNLYTGTVFEQHHLSPVQVVLLLRGIVKGESSASLSRELQVDYNTVLFLRHEIQANAEQAKPKDALVDLETESDEVFQHAGEKRHSA